MSLWRATDQPTAEIMATFFKSLKDGQAKHQALRNAKLSYLQNADPLQRHPANWATFVVLGNTNPISDSVNLANQFTLIFLGLLIGVIIFVALRRKKKNSIYKEA